MHSLLLFCVSTIVSESSVYDYIETHAPFLLKCLTYVTLGIRSNQLVIVSAAGSKVRSRYNLPRTLTAPNYGQPRWSSAARPPPPVAVVRPSLPPRPSAAGDPEVGPGPPSSRRLSTGRLTGRRRPAKPNRPPSHA